MPPTEYDPVTAEELTEMVEVGPGGEVTTWAWVFEPHERHPVDHPFAGAGEAGRRRHLDAARGRRRLPSTRMRTGMRVVPPRWRDEREGHINDLECSAGGARRPLRRAAEQRWPTSRCRRRSGRRARERVRTPASLTTRSPPAQAQSRFLRGLTEGKIIGEKAPGGKVYVPARGADPDLGVPTTEPVELAHTGTVTSFCIVNVQFYGQGMEVPYTSGLIQLDGSDLPIMHLLQEVDPADVHIGMRVEAVWADEAEWGPTLENIKWFRPTGEPDGDVRMPGERGLGLARGHSRRHRHGEA